VKNIANKIGFVLGAAIGIIMLAVIAKFVLGIVQHLVTMALLAGPLLFAFPAARRRVLVLLNKKGQKLKEAIEGTPAWKGRQGVKDAIQAGLEKQWESFKSAAKADVEGEETQELCDGCGNIPFSCSCATMSPEDVAEAVWQMEGEPAPWQPTLIEGGLGEAVELCPVFGVAKHSCAGCDNGQHEDPNFVDEMVDDDGIPAPKDGQVACSTCGWPHGPNGCRNCDDPICLGRDDDMYEYCGGCGETFESCHCCGEHEAVKVEVKVEERQCSCCAIEGNARTEAYCWFHSEQEREGALLSVAEAEELAICVKAAQDAVRLLDDRLEWAAKAHAGTDFDAWWACRQGWKGEK